jgi:hypothetical protein
MILFGRLRLDQFQPPTLASIQLCRRFVIVWIFHEPRLTEKEDGIILTLQASYCCVVISRTVKRRLPRFF